MNLEKYGATLISITAPHEYRATWTTPDPKGGICVHSTPLYIVPVDSFRGLTLSVLADIICQELCTVTLDKRVLQEDLSHLYRCRTRAGHLLNDLIKIRKKLNKAARIIEQG